MSEEDKKFVGVVFPWRRPGMPTMRDESGSIPTSCCYDRLQERGTNIPLGGYLAATRDIAPASTLLHQAPRPSHRITWTGERSTSARAGERP